MILRATRLLSLILCLGLSGMLTLHSSLAGDITIEGCSVKSEGDRLLIQPSVNFAQKELKIPRLFNTIRGSYVLEGKNRSDVSCQPELDHWILKWEKDVDWGKSQLVMELSSEASARAKLLTTLADGSFSLSACDALTRGSKLRFEPQPFKNTVGYWVDPKDFCWWTIEVEKGGKFNVEILQGCGAGQGGSAMEVGVYEVKDEGSSSELLGEPIAAVPFEVLETGHFQNFQARHLGAISIEKAGKYRVVVSVKKIAKSAAMDVRKVELVRLP